MPFCRIFLDRSDLPLKLLRESTSYFGYNPRLCFEALSFRKLDIKRKQTESVIRDTADNWKPILLLLRNTRTGGTRTTVSNVSHTVFQIFPPDHDTQRLLSDCHFGTVSDWALRVLLDQYESRESHAAADFYYDILGMPEAASLRGNLFKWQVLNHLCRIDTSFHFSIRRLTDSKKIKWTYHGHIRRINFQESTVINEITKAVRDREKVHLIPLVRNFPAGNSILYDPDDSNAVLTCIQITMDKKHDIVVSGLQHIEAWLNRDTPLKDLRPSINRPWRFVFVVPSGMADIFKLQKFVGDTARGEWAGKVHQYVLGLEEQTIFGRGSDSSTQHATNSQWEEQQVRY